MLIGMSGVFGFLLLLVGLMQASGRVWRVLAEWFPEPVSVKPSPPLSTVSQHAEGAAAEQISNRVGIFGTSVD